MKTNQIIQAIVVLGGLFYLVTGALLLFAPEWFFLNVGTYPPFNRHYTGDLGAFLLPLGIALLVGARNPNQHRLLIGYAAAGSLVHTLNHLYDDLIGPVTDPLTTASLLLFALLLGWAVQAKGELNA